MASTRDLVHIRYLRPPGRMHVFEQDVLERRPDCVVTFLESTTLTEPRIIANDIALENGAPVVWFTFPGAWHDIGRFHRADGTFTGLYANILTPVLFVSACVWETTDLFLDVWLGPRGVETLDAEELAHAEAEGWIDGGTAVAARAEAARLESLAHLGEWPPPIVHEWTLERARAAVL